MYKMTDRDEEPMEIKYESVDFGEFVIPDSSEQFIQTKVEQESTNGENVSNEEIGANSSEKNGGKIIKIKEETITAADSEFITIYDKDLVIDEVKFEEIVEETVENELLNCENFQVENANEEIGNCNEKEFRVIIIKCRICSKIFKTLSDLNSHECNVSDVSNDKTFTSGSKLKIHHPSHEVQAEIYKCHECKETFETNNSYLQHLQIHNKPLHVCQTCGKKFKIPSELKLHILFHISEKPHECEFCQERFTHKSDLIKHTLIHKEKKSFKCNECGKKFSQSSLLKRHLRIHTGLKPFECQICHKRFNMSGNLNSHLKIHSGEKLYKCEECKKEFTQSGHLSTHIQMVHLGLKPFSCQFCKKCFPTSGNLKSHVLIHTSLKPFKCETCDKSFARSGDLVVHIRTHTGLKPYECEFCKKRFTQRAGLNNHLRIPHDVTFSFKNGCEFCDQRFRTKQQLKNHVIENHNNEKIEEEPMKEVKTTDDKLTKNPVVVLEKIDLIFPNSPYKLNQK